MTISNTNSSRKEYSGNGSTVAFPITFSFIDIDDVNVLHVAADGTPTDWVKDAVGDAGYTVALDAEGDPVSEITANTAPEEDTSLILYRITSQTQSVDIPNNQRTAGPVQEAAFDKLTLLIQEMQEQIERVPIYSIVDGPQDDSPQDIYDYIDGLISDGITHTNSTVFIINYRNLNVDTELRLGRTTGGTASLTWNGEQVQCNKPFKPNQLVINNISASEPGDPYAGLVWLDVS